MTIDSDDKSLQQAAMDDPVIIKHITGKNIIKIITVKNKMVNLVVK